MTKFYIVFVVVCIILGRIQQKYTDKDYRQFKAMVKFAKGNEPAIKEKLISQDIDNNITSIQLNYPKTFKKPHEVYAIPGYVNNDKKLSFEANFEKSEQGEIVLDDYSISLVLNNLLKDEVRTF
ncbi:hypothetical protein [Companilactobacillus mishanensis]|uniref:DUF1310 family protein n=1 Tax=Companilactobacillus mishanensis TaxID=2486008 RepID=A0A5P0ZHP0_9LACO|nr:hypothetical protein [Companilactobacillus mishanensis]MQS52583.1 hypothetical protein [Companilactobacillus mishanensis]